MTELLVYKLAKGENPVFDIPDYLGDQVEIVGSGKPEIRRDTVVMDFKRGYPWKTEVPKDLDLLIIGLTGKTDVFGWLGYKRKHV